MKKRTRPLVEFIRSPFKIVYVLILITILLFIEQTIRVNLGIPDVPTEADNLTESQLWIGLSLTLLRIILNFASICFGLLFTLSISYFIYRIVSPGKHR